MTLMDVKYYQNDYEIILYHHENIPNIDKELHKKKKY